MLKGCLFGLLLITATSFVIATPINPEAARGVKAGIKFACIRRVGTQERGQNVAYATINRFCLCFAGAILPSLSQEDLANGNQFKLNDPKLIMADGVCSKILKIK